MAGLEEAVQQAERTVLQNGGFAKSQADDVSVAAVTLAPLEAPSHAHGVIAIARHGQAFTDDDREVPSSLGSRPLRRLRT